MEKYIIENGIKYELSGDIYYPMLKLDEQTDYQIDKYGWMHLDYIKQHHYGRYTTLLTEGKLNSLSTKLTYKQTKCLIALSPASPLKEVLTKT